MRVHVVLTETDFSLGNINRTATIIALFIYPVKSFDEAGPGILRSGSFGQRVSL